MSEQLNWPFEWKGNRGYLRRSWVIMRLGCGAGDSLLYSRLIAIWSQAAFRKQDERRCEHLRLRNVGSPGP